MFGCLLACVLACLLAWCLVAWIWFVCLLCLFVRSFVRSFVCLHGERERTACFHHVPAPCQCSSETDLPRQLHQSATLDRLVGLVVRRPPRERKVPGSNPDCAGIFSGSSHTSDLNIGTPLATLPGAWRYRVSAGTGLPGVSILCLGEVEGWICNFYLSVAARKIVLADPSLRYTRMLLGRLATNKQTNCHTDTQVSNQTCLPV